MNKYVKQNCALSWIYLRDCKGYLSLYWGRLAVSTIRKLYLRYFSLNVVQSPWKYDSFIPKTLLKIVI